MNATLKVHPFTGPADPAAVPPAAAGASRAEHLRAVSGAVVERALSEDSESYVDATVQEQAE